MWWVCASTYPRTSWNGVTPACGFPCTLTSASGYGVQPLATRGRKVVAPSISSGSAAVRVSRPPDISAAHTAASEGSAAVPPGTSSRESGSWMR